MKKNKIISTILLLCIMFTICIPALSPIISYAASETIYIGNQKEFLEFVKNCSYDAWSVGKTVVLTSDISLKDLDYEPIPSFSGTFDGNGKTIKDVNLEGADSPAGLFATVGKDGVVKNLTLNGNISPGGDKTFVGGIVGDNRGIIENCLFIGNVIGKSDVGGIAGINRFSGSITNCRSSAEIIGEARVGGIAGSNLGSISNTISNSKVNTVCVTPELSLSDINISLTLDLSKLPSLNNLTMTDIGGIAGYSTGIIVGCENNGPVGYPHIGYNMGGIAGRSSGHLSGNTNNAEINGRKDVGGIVGQIEPYISYNLSEDFLAALKTELDQLGAIVNGAVENTDGKFSTVSGRLDNILDDIDDATDSLDSLLGSTSDYGEDFIGEINRVSEILSEVLNQFSDISKDIPELSKLLGDCLDNLEYTLVGLEKAASIGIGAISDFISMVQDAATAFETISSGINKIDQGMQSLESSLEIKDKKAAEEALDVIADGIGEMIRSSDKVATSIDGAVSVLGDAAWITDAVSQFERMTVVFKSLSSALTEVYDATVEIDENIDIYWDNLQNGGDQLAVAFDSFTNAMVEINDAITTLEEGFENIENGLNALSEAVKSEDPNKLAEATAQVIDGFNGLVDAATKSSEAISALSEAIESMSSQSSLQSLAKIADALGTLGNTADEATAAITDISEGVAIVLKDVRIDFDAVNDGGALIIGGISITTDALEEARGAFGTLTEGMIALNNAVQYLKSSVSVKDEAKIDEALVKARDALGTIVSSVEDMAEILTETAKTMEDARIWGDKFIDSLKDVTESLSLITTALVKTQNGVDSLRENISLDSDAFTDGMSLIRQGFADVGVACGQIKDSLLHMSDALTKIESASGETTNIIYNLIKAIINLSKSADIITSMSEKANKLIGYLKGVDPVQIATPPESIKATAGELFASISAIETELKYLNTDLTGLGEDMIERIGKINTLFNEISDNIVDMIYGIADGSIVDNNVSEEEIDSVTNGRLFSCTNYGNVNGDINVGGIGGAMGIEYALDPEDDMSIELSVTQKKQYRLKAVIHASKNYGTITSKRDAVGGICGKMDFGLIYGCESYSHIQSQSGNYVGGIAGITAGLISQCFVKSTLSGGKYVGGVVGSGVNEDFSGDSSMVRNNYTMVEILGYTQYAGAISGANIGQYSENLFVSDELCGIDKVSYSGKAEPISYDDLIKRRSIPSGFYSFSLKFVADGVVISLLEFEYGESFDESAFPEIPKKDGNYGYWDKTDLQNLSFDTTVNAVYKPYVTALSSEEKRENGREVFFVRGEFTENDKLTVSKSANTAGLTLSDNFFMVDELVEIWAIDFPHDNITNNTIHFLPDSEQEKLMIKVDGVWQELDGGSFGSYLIFEANDDHIELAIIKHTIKPLPIIIISLLVLVEIGVVVAIILVNKKKNPIKEQKSEKESELEKATK